MDGKSLASPPSSPKYLAKAMLTEGNHF